MAYDLSALRTNVRNLLQNQTPSVLPDTVLDTILLQAKRRLDKDRPDRTSATVPGSGKYYTLLSGVLPGWVIQQSTIDAILNPTPDLVKGDDLNWDDTGLYRVLYMGGQDYLYGVNITQVSNTATIFYTTGWQIEDLDGATETTLTSTFISALEFAGAAGLCTSLSSRAAGSLNKQVPGDMIDWGQQTANYSAAAKLWDAKYMAEIRMPADGKAPAAIVRADFNPGLTTNRPYMTHFSFYR